MVINTPVNYDCQSFKHLVLPKKVVATGFVFVWADKENIPMILDLFEEKNFFYVENLVWVQSHDDDTAEMNAVGARWADDVQVHKTLLRRSKRTLLILRRGHRQSNGSVAFDSIDMRHQRNPDVIIAPYCTSNGEGGRRE